MTSVKNNKEVFNKKVQGYYKSLWGLKGSDLCKVLNEFYLYVLGAYKVGVIDSKEFAYTVAGTMQFDLSSTGKYKKIVELAGEYELPNKHISNNPDVVLAELISLIESL